MNSRENYLAAAYLEHLRSFGDFLPENASADTLEIAELHADRKAFRFTVRATLEFLSRDGKRENSEQCTVWLWENKDGLFIERIDIMGEESEEFIRAYEAEFAEVPKSGACMELIPIDSYIAVYTRALCKRESLYARRGHLERIAAMLESCPASEQEKAIRSAIIQAEIEKVELGIPQQLPSMETIASELIYRMYLGRTTGEAADLSDIMDRNESTDLFFYAIQLEADLARLDPSGYAIRDLRRGSAELEKLIIELPNEVRAQMLAQWSFEYVFSGVFSSGTHLFEIAYDKDRGVITAYSEPYNDSLYCARLKPLADSFLEQGMSWQEANRAAYERLLAELEEAFKDIAPATLPPAEPSETPSAAPNCEDITAEWLAAELMYRYYIGMRDLEQADFSDIMERNANTDLFFHSNQLDIDWVKLGIHRASVRRVEHPVGAVYYWEDTPIDSMYVWERTENENEITLIIDIDSRAFVEWEPTEPIGDYGTPHAAINADLHRITVDKRSMKIVDYYPYGAAGGGVYFYLEPIAKSYRSQGMSWQEAGRLAYEECYAKFEAWDHYRPWRLIED
jgi:hypothetical protein